MRMNADRRVDLLIFAGKFQTLFAGRHIGSHAHAEHIPRPHASENLRPVFIKAIVCRMGVRIKQTDECILFHRYPFF